MTDKVIMTEFGKAWLQKNGYYALKKTYPGKRSTSKMLHRAVYEKYKGPIPSGYIIHHIDENKTNNKIENLMCLSPLDHSRLHRKWRTINGEWKEKECSRCGTYKSFDKFRKIRTKYRDNIRFRQSLSTFCLDCFTTYRRAWRQSRKDKGLHPS